MTPDEIDAALKRGRMLRYKKTSSNIVIGRGVSSLMRWLDSGPHGEVSQASMDDGYTEEDEYDGY